MTWKQKKLILSRCIVLLFIVFSYLQWDEYTDFHQKNVEYTQESKKTIQEISNFELDQLQLIQNPEMFKTPNKKLLEQITNEINNAEKRVWLETYILTEKRIQQAVKKSHNNWVDVKVVLEKNPYKAYSINNKSYKNLTGSWVNVHWSNTKNFSLNHSKFLLIDDFAYISTWNFSYSTFTKNRDFFVKTSDPKIIEKLEKIFINDYQWKKEIFEFPNLVISPENTRTKFNKLVQSAQKNIDIYFQYAKDDKFLNELITASKKWIKIRIVFPKTMKDDTEVLNILKNNQIEYRFLEKNKMHSKAIYVDKKYLFLWSINFSHYSIDRNREIWIILKNSKILSDFGKIFNNDFKQNITEK